MNMKVERDLHMSRGDGQSSYATNSRAQAESILKMRPVLHEAVEAARASLSAGAGAMVVADLGCSSGPNTLLIVSEVLAAVTAGRREQPAVHVQFFLNDLPGNDFNHVFRSLEQFAKLVANEKGEVLPPYYIAGLPGSFYTRLFPDHCVHLFHSSYSLMWRSKVPDELSRGTVQNVGNMYIWENSPPSVIKLYQKQFQEDFSLFLKLRHEELVSSGQMVLTFLGRKKEDMWRGELSSMWGLLALALQSLVHQGRVEKGKLDSFNLPFYAPSLDEVEDVIKQSELFDTNHIQLFESTWDSHVDQDGELALHSVKSGITIAQGIRAVVEPLIMHHFGEHILDELFEIYAQNVTRHLQKVKAKNPVIVLSLQARRTPKFANTN